MSDGVRWSRNLLYCITTGFTVKLKPTVSEMNQQKHRPDARRKQLE